MRAVAFVSVRVPFNYPASIMVQQFTISDLAQEFDLTTRAIRFYEDMGLLQPLADVVKLLQKEDIIPAGADRALFNLAPVLATIFSLGVAAVLPLSPQADTSGQEAWPVTDRGARHHRHVRQPA